MRIDEFEHQLETTRPGKRFVYHRGNLLEDRETGKEFTHVDKLAYGAWKAMEAGKVLLFQRKVGKKEYEYFAQKRKRPYEKVEWQGCYEPNWNMDPKGNR